MIAMLIEAYGGIDALYISKEFPLQFLDKLLCQTSELRRDPEEREEEEREQAIEDWKQKNQGRTIAFTGPGGEVKNFTIGSNLLARMQDGFIRRDTDSNNSVDGSK